MKVLFLFYAFWEFCIKLNICHTWSMNTFQVYKVHTKRNEPSISQHKLGKTCNTRSIGLMHNSCACVLLSVLSTLMCVHRCKAYQLALMNKQHRKMCLVCQIFVTVLLETLIHYSKSCEIPKETFVLQFFKFKAPPPLKYILSFPRPYCHQNMRVSILNFCLVTH